MSITFVLYMTVSYKFTKEITLKLEYVFTSFETQIAFQLFPESKWFPENNDPNLYVYCTCQKSTIVRKPKK